MYDALIIGAGMSGLAAGIRLAQFGLRVCILERHTTIGGLNSFYRLDGRNYDVGLHAITNFQPRGVKQGPLPRMLRQLRLSWDDFDWAPQSKSAICFPGVRLEFSNDFALLESEIARAFPHAIDGFRSLVAAMPGYDQMDGRLSHGSARTVYAEHIPDRLLVEMLLCPLLYYGAASEHDIDLAQASIMFRSIFLEGFARPAGGVRVILRMLVKRFKELGGELRLRAGVRRIVAADDEVQHLELDDGHMLRAHCIFSSAGLTETLRMCEEAPELPPSGELSFVESMAALDCQPSDLDYPYAILFFNDHEQFDWAKPRDRLIDVRSGVICSPNNFVYSPGSAPPEGLVRMTALASYDRWSALPREQYLREKAAAREAIYASAVRFIPDFRPHVVATDTFTPTTIRHFTGHDNGAVYGTPAKRRDGVTHLRNLFVCGNDQGWVGIVGAMMSGIVMANRHGLKQSTTPVELSSTR
jgi:phytoene dehydrogenase-like protein